MVDDKDVIFKGVWLMESWANDTEVIGCYCHLLDIPLEPTQQVGKIDQ